MCKSVKLIPKFTGPFIRRAIPRSPERPCKWRFNCTNISSNSILLILIITLNVAKQCTIKNASLIFSQTITCQHVNNLSPQQAQLASIRWLQIFFHLRVPNLLPQLQLLEIIKAQRVLDGISLVLIMNKYCHFINTLESDDRSTAA